MGWEIRCNRERPLLMSIMMLAIGIRLAVALATTSWVFPVEENHGRFGYEMGQIAASLAMGNGFSWPEWSRAPSGPTSWMPPVYPLIMAAVFKGFGIYSESSAIVLELIQTIISVLTCGLLYMLGARLYNAWAGLAAAFLFAIYPPSIYYATRYIWGTSLFVFCLVLTILGILQQRDHPTIKGGLYLGILMGFTALVDPMIVSTYPFVFMWLYMNASGNRHTVAKMIIITLLALCSSIAPWLARNYIVFGQFVSIKSNLGYALYYGNNEKSTGSYEDAVSSGSKNARSTLTEAERDYLRRSNEVDRDNFLLQKAITFIMEHPLLFVQRTVNRFMLYWTYMRPEQGWQASISLVAYYTVLTLAIAGLFLSRVKGHDVQLVLLFPLLLPIPYYFTIVGVFRYRFPIEAILMIFAGYAIYRIAYEGKEIFIRYPFQMLKRSI